MLGQLGSRRQAMPILDLLYGTDGRNMRHLISEPARPLDTDGMPWIATGPGQSFRPLRFGTDGWSELMRLEPGSGVPLHRHTGEVHAFNLSGTREILGTGELVGAGNYVYEPAGTIDGWAAVGDEPCIVHIQRDGGGEARPGRAHRRGARTRPPAPPPPPARAGGGRGAPPPRGPAAPAPGR